MKNHGRRRLPYRTGRFAILAPALAASVALADDTVFRQLAEAERFSDLVAPSTPSRLDFVFDGGRALLRRDGTWRVEAVISHGGLRCGNYRLGVRFGKGKPDCLDVTWLSEPVFATTLKHCNNAERPHQRDGYDALLGDAFDEISCAERLIKCTGLCSARSPDQEPVKQFGD